MAEARGPTQLLDVCNQKFTEFLFNAEHKCLAWLREIEQEAQNMFDSNFNTEPELMPKTPSQKKLRKKKRSSSFKDENRELTRKRLSRKGNSVKPHASLQRSSPSSRGLKNLDVGITLSVSGFIAVPVVEETAEAENAGMTVNLEGESLSKDCSQNDKLMGKQHVGVDQNPENFALHSVGRSVDSAEAIKTADVGNNFALVVPDVIDSTKVKNILDAGGSRNISPHQASFDRKPKYGGRGEELPTTELVPERETIQDSKNCSGTTTSSGSGRPSSSRTHKKRRGSLVEKYSLSHKRKGMIRKSIQKTIAKKKAAWDSSSASSQVSCPSFSDVFMDEETSKVWALMQNADTGEVLNVSQNVSCALDVPNLTVCCTVESPNPLKAQKEAVHSKENPETEMTNIQVCVPGNLAKSISPHKDLQNSRRQSYKQALDELPSLKPAQDKDASPCSHKSSPTSKTPLSSGPGRITRPFRNFFQNMQKTQLLKSSVSPGGVMKTLIKCSTPSRPTAKEKERQRLESLRKKQEAEQQRKQKVEEEKRRRLEELKLKREERLRKALQARERVEQMEEEKKKRMGRKLSQHEERSEKVREEKVAEEKNKKKTSKKMAETEARKQKVPQMEEEQTLQERPERWKTVGEIKKMLEHSSTKQEKGHHIQQDKNKCVKVLELAVVKEEEENLKEEQNFTNLKLPQQEKKPTKTVAGSCANKWVNITVQKPAVGSSTLQDPKSFRANPNDYGMDLNSDDSTDDESQPRKPIPLWATGLQLNEAVTYQYYNPPDISKLFGLILSPKLEDIFYKSKPRYFKRTSSAVWQSPPLPGTKAVLRASNSMKKY